MPVSRSFVLDQLEGLGGVHARAMFGGVGLYADDLFFGLIDDDTLYLKVDDSNRGEYVAAGMSAFKPYPDRPETMSYYQVPVEVLEDAGLLVAWARRACVVAAAAPRRPKRRQDSRRHAPRDRRGRGGND
jgi:DNA transformation protein